MIRTLVKLEDILEVNPSSWSKKEGWTYLRYLDTANITNGRIDEIVTFDTKTDKIPSRARRIVQNGDFVYSTVRPNQKHFGLLKNIEDNLVVSTGFAVLRSKYPEDFDTRFIYLLVTQDFITNYLHGIAENNTSAYPALRPQDITDLEFEIPPISDQKLIADFIENLDDKIELNQKMNQTLEEIAKAIFKSWFVVFDPVRAKAEGRPTGLPPEISDLFPDELVDSEIGEIPKGWNVGALSDVADITMGQSPPGDTYNDNGVGLPFYQGSTDFGFRFPSLRKYCSEPKRLAGADDVLISVRAPVGDLNRAKDDCCIGRGLASLRAKNSLLTWVFYRCKFLSQQLETFNSEGTVFGSINGKDLKGLPTILPPEVLCKAFDEIGKPMDDAVRNRTLEIEVLTELRDTLLPKLISGELRIPDAEKFLEEADI